MLPYRVVHSASYAGESAGRFSTNSVLTRSAACFAASSAAWNSAALSSPLSGYRANCLPLKLDAERCDGCAYLARGARSPLSPTFAGVPNSTVRSACCGPTKSLRRAFGQVMTERSVSSADATPESRIPRVPSTVRKLFRVPEESVGVNHQIRVGDALVTVTTKRRHTTYQPWCGQFACAGQRWPHPPIRRGSQIYRSRHRQDRAPPRNSKINRSLLPYRVVHSAS